LSFIICHLSFSPAGAQTTFTQRVQKSGQGEGKVTIVQDKAIDELVNGKQVKDVQVQRQTDGKTTASDTTWKADEQKAEQRPITTTIPDSTSVADGRRKVMVGGYKINGYRVQAYAGGNQRRDRQRAEQVGNTIKASFPDEPVYVHFYSPRWICRVGNYRTYEEAHQMLLNIRKLGISGASIVKGKITVQ
jgi:hypothetical protein